MHIYLPPKFQILFRPCRYKIFKGGRGGGKSESIARALVVISSMEKTRVLCTRELQNSIKDSSYKLLIDIIGQYELPGFTYTQDIIRHEKGSEIIFKGISGNINAIKSMHDIDICWVEEAHFMSKASIDILLPSIRAKDSEIWFSYNPENDNDPISLRFSHEDKDTRIIDVNYNDNPFFPDVLNKERLACKQYRPDDYDHIWLGQPKTYSNLNVIKYFNHENIKNIKYMPDLPLHLSCDFNVDPMCWVIAHKTKDKVFFLDEIVVENTTTRDCIEEFIRRYKDHKGKIIINGDSSGDNRSTVSEFSNYAIIRNALDKHFGKNNVEFNLKAGNPKIKNRILAFNNKVLSETGVRCIFISNKCKWLLYNTKNLRYKKVRVK